MPMARLALEKRNCNRRGGIGGFVEGETLQEKNKRQEGVILQLQEENQQLREMLVAATHRIHELERKVL